MPAGAAGTCRATTWALSANPTDLYRRKTSGEIAEGESPALALGRPLGRARSRGAIARLRSVGCRAGAARNYAVADLTEKAKRGCVSPASDGRGGRGHVARLRSVGCRAGAARNYAEADLTEKAKRGCVSPASDGRGGRGHVARLRSVGCRAGAARNYAEADLTEKAKRGCASPFLLNLVEH